VLQVRHACGLGLANSLELFTDAMKVKCRVSTNEPVISDWREVADVRRALGDHKWRLRR
jgi:hypothetical protein